MAAMELVILSSSPRGPTDFVVTPPGRQQSAALSIPTSPLDLPSLSELIQRKPGGALKSASRAARLPEGAISGVASAASMIRECRLGLTPPEERVKKESVWDVPCDHGAEKADVPVKRAAKRAAKSKAEGEPVPKKPRKSRAKSAKKATTGEEVEKPGAPVESNVTEPADKAEAAASHIAQDDAPVPTKTKRAAKPRAKKEKEKDETQTKLKKGRVTKPRASEKPEIEEGMAAASAPKKRKKTSKVSEHFVIAEVDNERPAVDQQGVATEEGLVIEEAVRRRIDWTPPKDTKPVEPEPTEPQKEVWPVCVSQEPPRYNFAALMTDFAYGPGIADIPAISPTREPSGEALTKRRRIELIDPVLPIQSLPPSAQAEPSPAKKTKQPKKKARTITDLAMAQYKPVDPITADAPTVSTFFAPRLDSTEDKPVVQDAPDVAKTKSRKRAPRSKSPVKDGAKVKKPAAKKKKKVELVKPTLLSPTSAMHKMSHQDILFGTSSQLTREDSPTFVRDLQQAIRESEASVDAELVSEVAPVTMGSSLALVRSSRGLWSAAMRGFDDDLLAAEERNTPDNLPVHDIPSAEKALEAAMIEREVVEIEDTEADSMVLETYSAHSAEDRTVQEQEMEHQTDESIRTGILEDQLPPDPRDDDWTILSDDKPGTVLSAPATVEFGEIISPLPEPPPEVHRGSTKASTLQHGFPQLSPNDANADTQNRVPVIQERAVLQPLPVNVSAPKLLSSKAKAKRALEPDPPSKHPASTAPINAVRTDASTEPQPEPMKRPPGRPRKTPLPDSSEAAPVKRRTKKTPVLPDPPTTPKSLRKPDSEWTNIDEIEDSEQEFTPSPPRRTNPPASPPLQLIPPALPVPIFTASAAVQTTNGKPDTTALCAHLFPLITRLVRTAPDTTDPRLPSWHEKMLLYDPIVLEDLTAWLNAQGLRAPGKRGKDGAEKVEELKPWVVQKWCEEMSVCCLWREGLRGGVKNRY